MEGEKRDGVNRGPQCNAFRAHWEMLVRDLGLRKHKAECMWRSMWNWSWSSQNKELHLWYSLAEPCTCHLAEITHTHTRINTALRPFPPHPQGLPNKCWNFVISNISEVETSRKKKLGSQYPVHSHNPLDVRVCRKCKHILNHTASCSLES